MSEAESGINPAHRLAHDAMATTFEIIIPADTSRAEANAAAHRAFEEVDRLERELSRFIPSSDIARLRSSAAGEPIRLGFDAMHCLQLARNVHDLTHGAFDITLGGLTDFWKRRDTVAVLDLDPAARAEWQVLFANSGMRHLQLDPQSFSARCMVENLQLDLGAIGKGHAIDAILAALREWGIPAALAHGGKSSTMGFGHGAEGAWRVALRNPANHNCILTEIDLENRALSGSGVALHGAHIIGPRSGLPAMQRHAAWALAPSAALSDAISTACMLLSREDIETMTRNCPDVSVIILDKKRGAPELFLIG